MGLYWDNGKENGNYYNGFYRVYIGDILGLYWDNGKENGNYYNGFYRVHIGDICKALAHLTGAGPVVMRRGLWEVQAAK